MDKDYQPMNASQLNLGLQTRDLQRSTHLVEAETRLAPQCDKLPEKETIENTKDYSPGSVSNRNPGQILNGGACDSWNLRIPWP